MKKAFGFMSIALIVLLVIPLALFAGERKTDSAAAANKYYRQKSGLYFEQKWGKWERSKSGLYKAINLKVHPSGDVYIVSSAGSASEADFAYHRAQRFSDQGKYLGWFGGWKNGLQQPGWIAMPCSVSFAPNGDVHLLAALGGHVKTYSYKGAIKGDFSGFGGSGGPTTYPSAVCGDKDGHIFVSLKSVTDGFINKFDAQGTVLFVITKDKMGKGNGFWHGPGGLACDRFGNLYACDWSNNRVIKFDSDGKILHEFEAIASVVRAPLRPDSVYAAARMVFPDEVAISPDGTVYVLADSKVYRFDAAGKLIAVFGGKGDGNNLFKNAVSVACAPDGRVLVLDSDNSAMIASVKVLRPAYYSHKYSRLKLAGKVVGMSAADLKLVTLVVEGKDAGGTAFFSAARPASDGNFSFVNFPKDGAYRLSIRGTNTVAYREADDLTGTATGNVMNLNFVVVAK